MRAKGQNEKGFTLLELMIVITIIFILIGMAIGRYDLAVQRESLVLRPLEEMKGETVGRARSHAGQARELRDEVFHSRAEHLPYCADMPRIAGGG